MKGSDESSIRLPISSIQSLLKQVRLVVFAYVCRSKAVLHNNISEIFNLYSIYIYIGIADGFEMIVIVVVLF